MKLSRFASIALAGTASLVLAGSAVAQTVVMSGLDNPRGLAFAPNGALYVAEAGRGGAGPCVVNGNTGETRCFGKSGAITRLWKGMQSRVATGLESHAMPDGSSASGPNDISFQGTGGAYVTLGLGGDRAFQDALGGKYSGTLIHMAASGKWRVVADTCNTRSTRTRPAVRSTRTRSASSPSPAAAWSPMPEQMRCSGSPPMVASRRWPCFRRCRIPSFPLDADASAVPTAVTASPTAPSTSAATVSPFVQGWRRLPAVVSGQPPVSPLHRVQGHHGPRLRSGRQSLCR